METDSTSATTTTPATTTPATTPSTSATPTTTQNAPADGEPAWLPGRIAQAKSNAQKALLKELGAEDTEAAKTLIARAKQIEEAQKTELQKAQERATAAEVVSARAKRLEVVARGRAEIEMRSLTDAQRAVVLQLAGDDPAEQLEKIGLLKPSWDSEAATLAAMRKAAEDAAKAAEDAAKAAQTKPLPAGASTTGAPPTPNPTTQTPVSQYDTWQRMQRSNPLAAANYFEKNERAIHAQIEARRQQK